MVEFDIADAGKLSEDHSGWRSVDEIVADPKTQETTTLLVRTTDHEEVREAVDGLHGLVLGAAGPKYLRVKLREIAVEQFRANEAVESVQVEQDFELAGSGN